MQCATETEARGLLRVLLVRKREVPSNPTERHFVLCVEVIAYNQPLHRDDFGGLAAAVVAGERRRYTS